MGVNCFWDMIATHGQTVSFRASKFSTLRIVVTGIHSQITVKLRYFGTKAGLWRDLADLKADSNAICQHHRHTLCHWEVELVLHDASLLEHFKNLTCNSPENIRFYPRVDAKPYQYNKFHHVKGFTHRMEAYDLVLLKDHRLRMVGFPWATFLERKGDAVIASSLRQITREGLFFNARLPETARQWLPFYEARQWSGSFTWARDWFAEIRPVDVPYLDMSFVVMDGRFARDFFDHILNHDKTKAFVDLPSDWGVDTLWCGAAQSWAPSKPACRLVPVVAQYGVARAGKDKLEAAGFTMEDDATLKMWRSVPEFEKWMAKFWLWASLLQRRPTFAIPRHCNDFAMRNGYLHEKKDAFGKDETFDIQACAAYVLSV